ncbi:hypothetical protein XarbCFBP6827_13620 [Xanthomonas arboricola]|nr:hypothetical protein XarbCFBP8153_17530 [Xanthomonas arboricola]PPU52485.1 hypothetical protein XarbCFBP6827_13620 [Xanthomonas arboricola]
MPRKSLQGRTCGVSCDGRRARALQRRHRSSALQLSYPYCKSVEVQCSRATKTSTRGGVET